MKSFKVPLILVLVLGCLVGLAYWDEWKTKGEEDAAKTKNLLFSFEPADVVGLTYQHTPPSGSVSSPAGGVKLSLKKTDGQWDVVTPLQDRADAEIVSQMLQTVSQFKFEKKLTPDKSRWAEYGLENPEYSLSLTIPGKEPIRLMVGNKAPVGYGVYLRTGGGDEVYVASQYVATAMAKTLYDFRYKKVFPTDMSKLDKLTFMGADRIAVVIEKAGENWQVSKPEVAPADRQALEEFLSSLRAVGIEEFIDQPSELLQKSLRLESGAGQMVAQVGWRSGSTEDLITVVANNEEVYAYRSPDQQILRLGKGKAKYFKMALKDFKDVRVLRMNSVKIAKVRIDQIDFVKEKDDWFSESELKIKDRKQKDHIRLLLVDLEMAKPDVSRDLDGAMRQTLGTHKHEIALYDDSNMTTPTVVRIWQDKGDSEKIWVSHDDKMIHQIPADILHNLTEESFQQYRSQDNEQEMDGEMDEGLDPHNHGLHGS